MNQVIALMTLGLASGLLIGCIGIGGVILVPALVFLGGIPIHRAIPAAMLAYVLSGLVATTIFARQKSIRWDMAAGLCLAAAPAAFAGAWAMENANPRVLEVLIGLLTTMSGINSMRCEKRAQTANKLITAPTLLLIGAGTGFASSITGTGGPLVLVPILMALNLPVLTVIGLSQAIQLPIAIVSTFGNYLYGDLDWYLGCILAVALMIGSWQGARLAHSVPRDMLRSIVSVVLIVIGVTILANVSARLFASLNRTWRSQSEICRMTLAT
jgi:uncharacterized protein